MTQPGEPATVDNTADGTDSTAQADVGTTDTSAPDSGADTDAEPTPNSEAAKWRTRFREAETHLNTYRRNECEAAVADLLDMPSDLWEVGAADVTAFYNDDGTVNEAELRAAAGALIEMRPRLAKPQRAPSQWGQNSGPPPAAQHTPGWGDVIGRP